jgi:ATP-dependent RNA helicase RhlE
MNAQAQATELALDISFDSLPLAPFLKETIRTVGYTTPTPIQADAIPRILDGHDLIGLAQTGTGKTAAFVLPLLHKLSGNKTKGVQALILAPTRELAEQINDVIKTFSGRTGVKSVTVYGGVSHRNQITQLRNNPQIVVACPGRLMDHIRGATIGLATVQYLVLDEADRMLDMGFMPDIKAIIKELPTERQTMLFSATMPEEIATLSKSVLKDPTTVRVKSEQPVAAITHSMYSVTQEGKGDTLATWLQSNPQALAVVFTKMKHTAKRLGDRLTKAGVPATALHGNLSQAQRQRALQGFRDGRFRALIATDIASRGIDVEGVTHVVNYDMPDTLEAYIHRTGRAGRASRQGDAVSFVTRADRSMIRSIEQWLNTPIKRLNTEVAAGTDSDQTEASDRRQSGRGRPMRRDRDDRSARGGRPTRDRGERRGRRDEANDDARPARFMRDRRPRNADGVSAENQDRSFGRRERNDKPARGRFNDDRRGFKTRNGEERGESRARPERNKFEGERPQREFRGDRRQGRGFNDRPKRFERGGGTFEGGRSERAERGSATGFAREDRRGSSSAGSRKPFGSRSDRGTFGGGRPGPSKPQRPFRGQKDIDQNAEYVYRESQSHFIDRQDPEAKKFKGKRERSGQRRSGPRKFTR